MKAIQYTFSIPNYLATRAADKLPLGLYEKGKVPGLKLIETPSLPLPGPDWLRVRPTMAGICGSDTSLLHGASSPALSPFVSFPAVLGHETIGEVLEAGSGVTHVSSGDRIAIMPLIDCAMRGLEPCRACAGGDPGLCLNCAEGEFAPGLMLGFCKDLAGGWSDEIILHKSQAFTIPDAVSDDDAVLIEPFSVATHAVLRNPPAPGAKVLIIGAGSIGLLVLAALRMLGYENDITVLARRAKQETLAKSFGATRVLMKTSAADAAVTVAGAKAYKPVMGPPTLAGGFDWIFDCVGNERSVKDSLAAAGPRGQVMMVGCAGQIGKLDLTFVWSRELAITGSYVYGEEASIDGKPHTFAVALDLLAKHPEMRLGDMVTHRFPLDQWREAMAVSMARG
ncbi:MAG: alcohol dehydrogenase catalytic domain-containing protein, partial [Thermomicrobiales bacterium]|nr:alcohol dehydrogenase catalytic domain-containing protein [Thermomicrobiales bacterium]